MADKGLTILVSQFFRIQQHRIRLGHQLTSIKKKGDDSVEPCVLNTLQAQFDALVAIEGVLEQSITDILNTHPAWPWLKRVKGIGPRLGGKLLGVIGDISTYDTPSKLWRAMGYGLSEYWVDQKTGRVLAPVVGSKWEKKDGELVRVKVQIEKPSPNAVIKTMRDRPVKGFLTPYSKTAKSTCYLVGISFLKTGSPYARIFYASKDYYLKNRPDWTPDHIRLAAVRRMVKIFLVHLWYEWRKAEGLPTRLPYVHEKLGHTTLYKPEDFVKEA